MAIDSAEHWLSIAPAISPKLFYSWDTYLRSTDMMFKLLYPEASVQARQKVGKGGAPGSSPLRTNGADFFWARWRTTLVGHFSTLWCEFSITKTVWWLRCAKSGEFPKNVIFHHWNGKSVIVWKFIVFPEITKILHTYGLPGSSYNWGQVCKPSLLM
jgi:hypothetical protein